MARSGIIGAAPRYHVVFTGNFLYPRGMAETKRIQHAIDYLLSRGDTSVRVLPLRQSHPGRDDDRLSGTHKGVPYRTLGAHLVPGRRLPFSFATFLGEGFIQLITANTRDCRSILYLYNEPNLESLPFVLFARVLGYRVICDIVEDRYLIDASAGLLSRLKAYTAECLTRHIRHLVDGIVVISSRLEKKFANLTGGLLPIVLIPVTVNPDEYRSATPAFHAPIRILYAGSFGEKDDVANLISAFEMIRSKGVRAVLWLTGKGMARRMEMLEKRIDSSEFRADIHYLGYLTDGEYFRVLCECDIPCMVRTGSDYANSGFPFKLGEYLATGLPVLASSVGDVPRYLTDQVNAILVRPDSAAAIASGLEYLISNPAVSLEVGRRGRLVADREFNYRAAWSRLEALFS